MTLLQFLQIQLYLLVFYSLYVAFFSTRGHKILNRAYLLIMPVVACILPFVSFHSDVSQVNWVTTLPTIEVLQNSTISTNGFKWELLFYGAAVALFLLFFLIQVYRLFVQAKGKYEKEFEGCSVYYLEGNINSHSFFNRIYINPKKVKDEHTVLVHERAHCKELHTIDLLIISLYKSLFWFNPIIYYWSRLVKENHEYLADQYVIHREITPSEYGQLLIGSAFNTDSSPLTNAFNSKSFLRKRLEHLNHKNQHSMKHLIILPLLAGLTFLSSSMNTEITSAVPGVNKTTTLLLDGTDPEFPGGADGLMKFILSEIKYPDALKSQKVEGTVYVSFEIAPSGKVENAKVIRSSTYKEMDAEALRVVEKMPNWEPGVKGDKKVRTEMKLPFNFAI